MKCNMVLVRNVGPHQRLKRCESHGIATVEDGSTGMGHSPHPNIDASGSVRGMKDDLGYWQQTDLTVQCHGYIFNVSSLVVTDELDAIADQECQCGGHRLLARPKTGTEEKQQSDED